MKQLNQKNLLRINMEQTETLDVADYQEQVNSVNYRVVHDKEDKRLAVQIGNGYFENFFFKINHLRLTFENEQGIMEVVKSYDQVEEKEVVLDFEYDLCLVPPTYTPDTGDQEEFEHVARNILIDVLMNRQELYAMETNEHQANIESAN